MALPPVVEAWLRDTLLRRARPLLLSFDADWHLREVHGDPAHFGFDGTDGLRELQDLFIGLPLDGDQDLPFIELRNGRSVHVHLIAEPPVYHVLLLDAEEQRSEQRAQQQLGNDAVLAAHEKSKAIGRLQEIRSELEQQRARLEEANALKNALIATLSHDFRTPLTSIFGYLHLLEKPLDHAHAQQALGAVRRNASYLFTLAENLLEYGRGEAGALLNPGVLAIDALAQDIDDMFRPLAEDKQLAFDVRVERDDDPTLPMFDEVRVRQIVVNLLSNAVRYTQQGRISAFFDWRGGRLRMEISDTGVGISPEFRERVFQPFNRGGNAGSKGAGLGLSIVRRLIEQMGGTMALDSEPGQGTCFTIDLPPMPLETAPGVADADMAPWVQGLDALVVDDDPDIGQLLEALLLDLGFRVRLAMDASAAVAEATRQPPDLLLIDVEMPGLSGNAAVFKLRSHGYRGRIITLSATATAEARDAALRAGADYYLTKPLNLDRFVGMVQRAMQPAQEPSRG